MSELVTAHDLEKLQTADRKIPCTVNFLNSKKISKLGTEAQFSKPRRARVVIRRGVARRAAEEEEHACKPLIFSHFRR
jgi:hypothetical protein